MNIRLNALSLSSSLALSILMTSPVMADEFNKRTDLEFSAPVQIPGHVLAPGKYVFELMDNQYDRNIVEVFSPGEPVPNCQDSGFVIERLACQNNRGKIQPLITLKALLKISLNVAAIDRNHGTPHFRGVFSSQPKNQACELFRVDPFRGVGVGICSPVCRRVNCPWQEHVSRDAGTFVLSRDCSNQGNQRRFGRRIGSDAW